MTAIDDDLRHLVELYDEKWEIIHRNAELAGIDRLTGSEVDEAFTAGVVLDTACEQFKRNHYPRRAGRVVVGLRMVFLSNRTGQTMLFDPETAQQIAVTADAGAS